MKIINSTIMKILNSRGKYTLNLKMYLEDGSCGKFDVPSGKSKGENEACEVNCDVAIKNFLTIKERLNREFVSQKEFDEFLINLDSTKNKSKLGGNLIIGLSCAFCVASAKYYEISLFKYLFLLRFDTFDKEHLQIFNKKEMFLYSNVINGGVHTNSKLMIQEFMIVPLFSNIKDKIDCIKNIYSELNKILVGNSKFRGIGDEGGFSTGFDKNEDVFECLILAIKNCGYNKKDVIFAIDVAGNEIYKKKKKLYEIEKGRFLNSKDLVKYYLKLIKKYPLYSIEDPFYEGDEDGWRLFNSKLKGKIKVVGDDLIVTNPIFVKDKIIDKKLCSTMLLKINQIGTITEAIKSFNLCCDNKNGVMISHRSGETNSSFISDLAVALGSSIKLGAPCRGERISKYNRLLEIFE